MSEEEKAVELAEVRETLPAGSVRQAVRPIAIDAARALAEVANEAPELVREVTLLVRAMRQWIERSG